MKYGFFAAAALCILIPATAAPAVNTQTFTFSCEKIGTIKITTPVHKTDDGIDWIGDSVTLALRGKPLQTLKKHPEPGYMLDVYSNEHYRFFTYRANVELTTLKNGKDVKRYQCE